MYNLTGYICFPVTPKSLFIADSHNHEAEARQDLKVEDVALNFWWIRCYLGTYLGPREQLEALVQPQVEAWEHWVYTFDKISNPPPHFSYASLGMLLKLE